jgi:predicted nuclease of predicted toxin-antitoxin system
VTLARFHLDESVSNAVAYGLRSRGRDCTISKDARLLAGDDAEHLAYAVRTERVLITRDNDFKTLHSWVLQQGEHHPGILYWCSRRSLGSLVREIDAMASQMTAEEFRDQFFFF